MKRLEAWPELLHEFLEASESQPFAWGVRDCATFTCDAVLVMTGVDLASDFRGQYSNVGGAARTMRKFAGGGVEAVADKVTKQHGMPEISPKLAQRGDVVLVDGESEPALGIVSLDAQWAVTITPRGPQKWPALSARRAWRVG